MLQDETVQWGFDGGKRRACAPASKCWHCPKCKSNSLTAEWQEGSDDSRICPNPLCGYTFTIEESGTISEADKPGRVMRDQNGNKAYWCVACQDYHVDPRDQAHRTRLGCKMIINQTTEAP